MPDQPWHADTVTEMGVPHPYKIVNLGTTHKNDADEPKPLTPAPMAGMSSE